ncbi:MAG: SDR family oxidoreductase [Mycobacterium sp.]
MTSLQSKVFIVTGGLGGIGSVTAGLLADAGAHVVVTDLVDGGGTDLAADLTARGAEAAFLAADLTQEDQVRALVDFTIERFGHLDGAFNNAGIPQHGKPLVELTSAEFDKVMRVNVLGVFHCLKHQMSAMKDGGSIVLTSSGLGVTAFPDRAEYIASKHAICGLARAAAVEGAPFGIRVNAVLPGSIRTPMAEAVFGSLDNAADQRAGVIHLLPRLGESEEVGFAVRWLLSDEASFVTGALMPVDGGTTAGRRV